LAPAERLARLRLDVDAGLSGDAAGISGGRGAFIWSSVALIDARQEFDLGNRSAGNLAGNIGWRCAVPLPK